MMGFKLLKVEGWFLHCSCFSPTDGTAIASSSSRNDCWAKAPDCGQTFEISYSDGYVYKSMFPKVKLLVL